jgi:hypothetical protein
MSSMTTKSHLAGDHSVEQQGELGIGDMGKDCGEQNQQDEAKPLNLLDASDIFGHESQSRAKRMSRQRI